MKSYFPEEGTTFVSNTVGIAKGSTHGKLAEVWINFLLEKEQQGRIASNLGFSVRSDVAIDPKVAELLPSGKALESSLLPNWGDISKKQAGWIEHQGGRRQVSIALRHWPDAGPSPTGRGDTPDPFSMV